MDGKYASGKELAQAHWKYIHQTLLVHEIEAEMIEVVEHHYITAFEHGYKHGQEDAQ